MINALAKTIIWSAFIGLGFFATQPKIARAESGLRPASPPLLDWKQTADIEHMDRMNRLKRLSDRKFIAQPEFHEHLISRQKLRQYNVDLRVLRVVFSQSVFFDTDKDEVRREAVPILDLVAETLRRDVPDVAVFVAGHTDSRGSDEYNYSLSVRRADSVARALFARGIGLARIWRIGFGESVPLLPNSTAQNMARNRRVEFLISAKPEAPVAWLADQPNVCGGPTVPAERVCRLVAIPVMRPEATTVSPKEEREVVAVPKVDRPDVTIGGAKADVTTKDRTVDVTKSREHETITVGPTNPVIIDLHERRIEIGRPVL
jgi:outer membrane protein OmpA-like peptidoglycan-associated protein